jgi:hypothetical protein
MRNFTSRRWTVDDIATLKNLARKYPAAAIAGQLGRSAAATAIKAHELKLSLKMQRRKMQADSQLVLDRRRSGINPRD